MAPKHHPTPLSGGDRKALAKELGRAMTTILAAQPAEARAKGEAIVKQADRLLCESWNERMWSDGQAHRAVDDCHALLEVLAFQLSCLKKGPIPRGGWDETFRRRDVRCMSGSRQRGPYDESQR
jgi:hypothetical protein